MNLEQLRKTWEDLGKEDPLWAVLTHKSKQKNKWTKSEFFSTGEQEIRRVLKQVTRLNKKIKMKKALDFGCGVGRLTQPLADFFHSVYGIDIAESMIETAKKYNTKGEHCKFIINRKNNLSLFKNNYFDFIYSSITLQHMRPEYAINYIKEFLRVLSPNGMLVFQIPNNPANTPKGLLIRLIPKNILNTLRRNIEMYSISKEEILNLLDRQNAVIVDIQSDKHAGSGWVSYTYFIMKRK